MSYVQNETIRALRERKALTQKQLAEKLCISDKTISKWETGKGLPDISLLEDLARALGVSLTELMTGDLQTNENRSANLRRMGFYVCPVCGNVITAVGKGSFSCCGIPLPVQEAQPEDNAHTITVEPVEDEICVTIAHPMTKSHYISFIAWVSNDRAELVKLYPEQDITVRFKKRGHGTVYAYCNRDGLFSKRL
ncbi:helix-turn-helix domain-containing protein [uncultured Gemmiger sp.]|uniref:helix-turn-helix domain-containing protein n=1 Tax=uncultured Gemmiger sp. TaxID=1623490 RepID=UPI0025EAB3AA|nr:helix-turn-helix domain-containing protein [uncultured Gemmiger sp.]